jgi:hypothetical protein
MNSGNSTQHDGIALALYCEVDHRIAGADADGLRARWDFGRMLLAERVGKKLPPGRLDEIAAGVGKSHQELQFRMQFAERFPDEDALSNAVRQYSSWHRIVAQALKSPKGLLDIAGIDDEEEAEPTDPVIAPLPEPMRTYTGVLPGVCPNCRKKVLLQVSYDPSSDEFSAYFVPPKKLGKDWYPGEADDVD